MLTIQRPSLEEMQFLEQQAQKFRQMQMGLYSDGPFCRIDIFRMQGKLCVGRSVRVETPGTAVHTLRSKF